MIKKTITTEEAYLKLSALCASAEHCSGEMVEKMQRWGLSEKAQAEVLAKLTERQFIDDERFCRAFVNDKILYNKWGRRKIEQALYMKHIDKSIQQKVLDTIDPAIYVRTLHQLLQQREKSIKAANDYERTQKLIRFALQRGFTMDIIETCIS
jgi:regulatory protein